MPPHPPSASRPPPTEMQRRACSGARGKPGNFGRVPGYSVERLHRLVQTGETALFLCTAGTGL